jgi:uncharacterized protein (DUF433 family)
VKRLELKMERGFPPPFTRHGLRRLFERVIFQRMDTRLINSDPEILSGTPVFAGTRVPVKNLTDCLEAGDSIDEFLEDFPSVKRDQIVEFLEEARAAAFAQSV